MGINGLIGYYRACFREDASDFNLRNLLKLKSEDLLFIKGQDEIASGTLHRLPINPDYGESFSKRTEIYQRERVLLHSSLFVSGKLSNGDDSVTLFSPLIFNEAKIEQDEYGCYFSVDPTAATVNEDLLALLLPDLDVLPDIDQTRLYDPSFWSTYLASSTYELNYLTSLNFPTLGTRDDATKALRRKHPSLLPISCLAFIERSVSSRGVLHELSRIIDQKRVSAPLQALLGEARRQPTNILTNDRLVPGTLSKAQKSVINIAANHSLGVVSGPPGTGKSYTIAAIAAEHFTRQQSVLIVAGSETALDVISDKLERDFDLENLPVRAGQKAVLKEFKQYLDDLLAGYFDHSEAHSLATYKTQLESAIKQIVGLETQLHKQSERAFKSGQRAHKIESGIASTWDKILHKLTANRVKADANLWRITEQFGQLIEQKESLSSQFLNAQKAKTISTLLNADRKAVQTLNKAARARTSAKQSEYFSSVNFDSLLTGFPVWLVTLNTLHRVLPLNSELFDLVIIDEATQCNIASALPALARAKRALIVGDQKQLRHYSFLSRAKQHDIKFKYKVDDEDNAISYRDNSILDLALQNIDSQAQVAFLDEHYRSQPELIDFSNGAFYDKQLKIMQHRPCSTTGHIQIIDVDGTRSAAGINTEEANAVLDFIQNQISQDKGSGIAHSIGVLSPFSKQAAHLSEVIEQHITLDDLQRHKIRVATPYGFQGEERDIMLLSMAIDNKSKRAAIYLNKPDVFNVAVTRARQQQIIFKSVNEQTLPANSLLKQYLRHCQTFSVEHQFERQPDEFQHTVVAALMGMGFECWQSYEMLGTYVDVLVKKEGKYAVIDLIGYPGPWQDYFELNTYKVIKRAGIDVIPLSYALWLSDPKSCLDAISQRFG